MTILIEMIVVYSDLKKIANTNAQFSGYIWADIESAPFLKGFWLGFHPGLSLFVHFYCIRAEACDIALPMSDRTSLPMTIRPAESGHFQCPDKSLIIWSDDQLSIPEQ
jgi:hypothetical protein